MEKKVNKWRVKFNEFKTKFSSILPKWDIDKINHFQVVFFIGTIITIFTMVSGNAIVGIWSLVGLLLIGGFWELETLTKEKFSRASIMESVRDLAMTIFALFGYFVILLYEYTRLK